MKRIVALCVVMSLLLPFPWLVKADETYPKIKWNSKQELNTALHGASREQVKRILGKPFMLMYDGKVWNYNQIISVYDPTSETYFTNISVKFTDTEGGIVDYVSY